MSRTHVCYWLTFHLSWWIEQWRLFKSCMEKAGLQQGHRRTNGFEFDAALKLVAQEANFERFCNLHICTVLLTSIVELVAHCSVERSRQVSWQHVRRGRPRSTDPSIQCTSKHFSYLRFLGNHGSHACLTLQALTIQLPKCDTHQPMTPPSWRRRCMTLFRTLIRQGKMLWNCQKPLHRAERRQSTNERSVTLGTCCKSVMANSDSICTAGKITRLACLMVLLNNGLNQASEPESNTVLVRSFLSEWGT